MKKWKIFDTFDDFEEIWPLMENTEIENQIEIWVTKYMDKWPDLLKMQIESYQNDGEDWKKIALMKMNEIDEKVKKSLEIFSSY